MRYERVHCGAIRGKLPQELIGMVNRRQDDDAQHGEDRKRDQSRPRAGSLRRFTHNLTHSIAASRPPLRGVVRRRKGDWLF